MYNITVRAITVHFPPHCTSQEENRDVKTQLQRLAEKESKASREVERLRAHLLQVEEGYTRELLEAEEREKDLRNRLAGAEERAVTASSSVDRAKYVT